jgi:hypothetical protein
MSLVEIHRDAIAKLIEKYGEDRVNEVNNFDPNVVLAISKGEEIPGVTDEQCEIIYEFNEHIVNHPKSNCTARFVRPKRIFN